jgi:large subunit ribosomal protein L35
MERIYQMNVVPDLVSDIRPSLDLRITTGLRPKSIHPKAKNPLIVEPGSFLTPKQVSSFNLVPVTVALQCL